MNKDKISILHRHWIWADKIKMLFQKEISHPDLPKLNINNFQNFIISPFGTYMFIWYGLLFVVLEALKEEKIIITDINNEIDEIYESLRIFRNAVFHTQNQYWSSKFFKIMENDNSVSKIWKVHQKVGDFLLEEMNKIIRA